MTTSKFLNYGVLLVLLLIGAWWLGHYQSGKTQKQVCWAKENALRFEIQAYRNMLVTVGGELDKKRTENIRLRGGDPTDEAPLIARDKVVG